MAYLNTPDHYLTNTDHTALIDALSALDRDPAHPHPLRDRLAETLGEIGGVWPRSCLYDQLAEVLSCINCLLDPLPELPVEDTSYDEWVCHLDALMVKQKEIMAKIRNMPRPPSLQERLAQRDKHVPPLIG